MVCPPGRVKTSDQPLTAVVPVLVMVMLDVRPVFQALTVSATRHVPVPDGGLLGLGEGELGLGDAVLGVGVGLVRNCAKKLYTAAEVHVLTPLVAVDPSTGSGVWSPSNAAHWTGYPGRHPA